LRWALAVSWVPHGLYTEEPMLVLNFLENKYVIAPAALVATVTLFFVIRRLNESPERKNARKLLGQIVQARLNIIAMQEDGEGLSSAYEQANRLLDQARAPGSQAEIAFKQKRYADAEHHAIAALNLLDTAYKAQCPQLHIGHLLEFDSHFRPRKSERFGSN
jgi:hypothetical protein